MYFNTYQRSWLLCSAGNAIMPSGTNVDMCVYTKSVHAILTTILLFPRCVCDEHNGTTRRSAIPRCILMCHTAIVIQACMHVSSCTKHSMHAHNSTFCCSLHCRVVLARPMLYMKLHNISDTLWPWPFALQNQHRDAYLMMFCMLNALLASSVWEPSIHDGKDDSILMPRMLSVN